MYAFWLCIYSKYQELNLRVRVDGISKTAALPMLLARFLETFSAQFSNIYVETPPKQVSER